MGCAPSPTPAAENAGAAAPEQLTPQGPAGDTTAVLPGSRGPVTRDTTIGSLVLQPISPSTGGIRIATFNVEFLFDGIEPEGAADFPWKGDTVAAANHRRGVAAIIRQLNADVLVLQEVEHAEVLQSMVNESLADLGYEVYYVPGRDTFTRQDIGILSRLPIDEIGRTDERAPVAGGRETYGVSKNMWARLQIGEIPTTIIGLHLLARPSDTRRTAQREAQAQVIAQLIRREIDEGREVIVIGDFNDFDPTIPDRAGSVPIARTLAILKSAGTGLKNVMKTVPPEQRFTALWDRNRDDQIDDGELTAIDHVLLSPGLALLHSGTEFVHGHDPRHGPDHFPIVITIDR